MKIDFTTIDLTGFKKVPCTLGGVECVLIFPEDIKVKFNEQNKYFRSSIWTLNGQLVSPGYRKFVNFGEQPEFEPLDITDKNLQFPSKIDGSCLIVSRISNELIIRTRQTFNARLAENGAEIDYLIKKYPKAFDNEMLDAGYTCIYEWTTPSNIIVLRYANEPELWLTGIINHSDYSYCPQAMLDGFANFIGVKRGKTYKFNSFEEMKNTCEAFTDQEGIVVYSGDGQTLKKVKSLKYLYLHKLKSKLRSNEALVDFFLSSGCTNQESFKKHIEENVDYEIFKMVEPMTYVISNIYSKVTDITCTVTEYINNLKKEYITRKDQAMNILAKDKLHSWFYFAILDNKPITNEMKKKLMMEELNLVNKEI